MYSLLLDDFTGGFRSRSEARDLVDEMLTAPLDIAAPEDIDQLAALDAELRASWGMSEEAIAAQENWNEAP